MEYSKQTVPALKALLTKRELPTNGLKADLVSRLNAADESQVSLGVERHCRGGELRHVSTLIAPCLDAHIAMSSVLRPSFVATLPAFVFQS